MLKKKVLIVLSNLAVNNGVASCIMNNYSSIRSEFGQVDFLVLKTDDSIHEDHIQENGGQIFVLPEQEEKLSKIKQSFLIKLLTNDYSIVHVNIPYHNGSLVLKLAKKADVPVRIYHSHNPKRVDTWKSKIRSEIYTPMCVKWANCYLACSELAGDTIFGKKKYKILHNAIHADRYVFNVEKRDELHRKYKLNDKFVVGAVCRIDQQKNPYFIIDVFEEIIRSEPCARLVWLGSGNLEKPIKEYIHKKKLDDFCLMLGSRSDVNEWYSAMDVLLFPSLFEGLGMVLIEAQTSGLVCFASDCVPLDTKVTDLVHFKSLDESAAEWAKQILNEKGRNERLSHLTDIQNAGYDVNCLSNDLLSIYKELLN